MKKKNKFLGLALTSIVLLTSIITLMTKNHQIKFKEIDSLKQKPFFLTT